MFGAGNDVKVADGTIVGTPASEAVPIVSPFGDAAYTGDVQFGAGMDVVALADLGD